MKKSKSSKNIPQKITLFWGAGAAAFAGYKTFQNFPELFWPSRDKRSVLPVSDKEEKLLNKVHLSLVKAKYPTTLDSYLRIINELHITTESLQSSSILRDDLSVQNPIFLSRATDLNTSLHILREAICALTAEHYRADPLTLCGNEIKHNVDQFMQFIDLIVKNNETGSMKVFTTNYDISMEHIFWLWKNNLQKEGWLLDNGFIVNKKAAQTECVDLCAADEDLYPDKSVPWYANWRKNYVGYKEDVLPQNDIYRSKDKESSKTMQIFRLHGCVAWVRGNRSNPTVFFNINNKDRFESFSDRLCVSYPGHEDCLGHPPHVDSWREFHNCLRETKIFIIIGFAFRDCDVLSVLGRVLSNNPLLKILIIDPRINSLKALLERIQEKTMNYAPPYPKWNMLLNKENTIFMKSYFPLQDEELLKLERIINDQ